MTVYINGVSDEIKKTLLTTVGDTIYASAASTPSRLGAGANDSVGQIKSSIPAWRTLAQVIEELLIQDQWRLWQPNSSWATALAGSGAVIVVGSSAFLNTGASAGSTAYVHSGASGGFFQGSNQDVTNFSKRIVLEFIVSQDNGTTNGITRVILGRAAATIADFALRSIGFQIANFALKGIVHNGTLQTTVDLATNIVQYQGTRVKIVSDGAGNVEWFVNGVSKGTTASGPTGTATELGIGMGVINGADAAVQQNYFHSAKGYFAQ